MFDALYKTVKKIVQDKQPISTTGAIWYSCKWLTATEKGKVYLNPACKLSENHRRSDAIAIYCVHGTADHPAAFSKITKRLLAKGLPEAISSIHLVSFGKQIEAQQPPKTDIAYYAELLMEEIKLNGHKKVILLGHSRGGLINAYAAENCAARFEIEVLSVSSICSPFQGSALAKKCLGYFSATIPQMAIGSPFLKELNRKIADSTRKYYFFVANADVIVSPRATVSWEYAYKHPTSLIILERHGHLSILSSHRLVDHLFEFIVNAAQITNCSLSEISKNDEKTISSPSTSQIFLS
ncbi:MAG: alpha/beta hydrolase [Legionella sp.]|nr:alpha/beta hydrolase [Legionella sp.]